MAARPDLLGSRVAHLSLLPPPLRSVCQRQSTSGTRKPSIRCPHHSTVVQSCHGCQPQNLSNSVGTESAGISRPHHGRLARGRPCSSTQVGRVHAVSQKKRARHSRRRTSVIARIPMNQGDGEHDDRVTRPDCSSKDNSEFSRVSLYC